MRSVQLSQSFRPTANCRCLGASGQTQIATSGFVGRTWELWPKKNIGCSLRSAAAHTFFLSLATIIRRQPAISPNYIFITIHSSGQDSKGYCNAKVNSSATVKGVTKCYSQVNLSPNSSSEAHRLNSLHRKLS